MDFNTIFHKFSSAISSIGQTILPQAKLKSGHNIHAQEIRIDNLPFIGIADKYASLLHYYKQDKLNNRPYSGWYVNAYKDRIKYIAPKQESGYKLVPVDINDRSTWRVQYTNTDITGKVCKTFQTGFIAPVDVINSSTGELSDGYEVRIYLEPLYNFQTPKTIQNNGKWKFDYYAGILTFDSDFIPDIDIPALYIEAFQYIGRTVSSVETAVSARLSLLQDQLTAKYTELSGLINNSTGNLDIINTHIDKINSDLTVISGVTDALGDEINAAVINAEQQLADAVNTLSGEIIDATDTIISGMLVIQPYTFTTKNLLWPTEIVEQNNYKLGIYSVQVPGFCFNVEAQIIDKENIYSTQLETIIIDSKYHGETGTTTLYIKLDTQFIENDGYYPMLAYNNSLPAKDIGPDSIRYYRNFIANSFEYKVGKEPGKGIVKLQQKPIN